MLSIRSLFTARLWCYASLSLLPLTLQAENSSKLFSLVDLRLTDVEDTQQNWLDGGLDPFRFDQTSEAINLGQALAGGVLALSETLSINGFASAYADDGESFGVNEIYLKHHQRLSDNLQFRLKAGAFYPEISIENTSPGWTSGLTLTNSAVNTWIGEEIRLSGFDLALKYQAQQQWRLGTNISLFGNNDAAGTMLAWRGWAMHDRQLRLNEKVPIAAIPSISPSGAFSLQSPYYEPFTEVDDRPGYAFSLSAQEQSGLRVKLYRYNNLGSPTELRKGQYAWATRFWHLGISVPLRESTRLYTQWLDGSTFMGRESEAFVNLTYRAWYVGLAEQLGDFRINIRYDRFEVSDHDTTQYDDSTQDGDAWTVSLSYLMSASLSLIAEHTAYSETNKIREQLSLDTQQNYSLTSLALQWRY